MNIIRKVEKISACTSEQATLQNNYNNKRLNPVRAQLSDKIDMGRFRERRFLASMQLRNFKKLGTRILQKIRKSSIAKKLKFKERKFQIIIKTLNKEFPNIPLKKFYKTMGPFLEGPKKFSGPESDKRNLEP